MSPLYRAEIVTQDWVALPVGAAYEVVREYDDSQIYAYGIFRARRVGVVTEPLCYIVAINLPTDSGMTGADAKALIESMRYR